MGYCVTGKGREGVRAVGVGGKAGGHSWPLTVSRGAASRAGRDWLREKDRRPRVREEEEEQGRSAKRAARPSYAP
jgi:hypothetical protein